MGSIWSECQVYDNLDPSRFEVDLNKVLRNEGPLEYREPEIFFGMTYSTKDLKNTLRNVDSALGGSGIVIGLRSPLGGGKTHTLLTLYHAFRTPEKVTIQKNDDDPFGLPRIKNKAAVVAFDGRDVPAGGEGKIKTLWGALANSLDLYGIMKRYDETMQPPEMNVVNDLLKRSGPTLIMIDELPAYMEKAMAVPVGNAGQNLARLTLEFLHTLTDSVKGSKAALIIPIPEESYEERGAEIEKIMREANAIMMRVAELSLPHSQEDLAGILKKRLFKRIAAESAKESGKSFAKYYMKLRAGFPSEVSEPNYSENMIQTYPFHPSMIKLLTEKITAIPGFQRTRGILRLMAAVVESMKQKPIEYAIMPGDVDLSDDKVANELLKNYLIFKSVIKTDISNRDLDARAQLLKKSRPAAVKVATTVFLNSFTLSGKDIANVAPTSKDVAVQISKPEENPFEVDDTVTELSNASYFMIGDQDTKRYFYTVIPNINRMIDYEASRISDTNALDEIRKTIQNKIGVGVFKVVYSWNASPDDRPEPCLVILDPTETGMEGSLPQRAEELWAKNTSSFRTYKNSLVFAYVTPQSQERLIDISRRLLAVSRLNTKGLLLTPDKKDNELARIVEEINRKKLQSEANKIKVELALQIVKAYSNAIYPTASDHGQMILASTGLPMTASAKDSIQGTIQELLDVTKGAGKLTDVIPADMLFKEVLKTRWFDNGNKPTIKDVIDVYYSDAKLVMPTSSAVIIQSINHGIKEYFALKVSEDNYVFNQSVYAGGSLTALIVPKQDYEIWKTGRSQPPNIEAGENKSKSITKIRDDKAFPKGFETKTIPPQDILAGDKISVISIEGKEKLEDFLRMDWATLKSKLLPKEVRVSLNFEGTKANLEIKNAEVNRAPIMKFNTIVNDLVQFSDISRICMTISITDSKAADIDLTQKIKDYPIAQLIVEREV